MGDLNEIQTQYCQETHLKTSKKCSK